MSAQPPLVIIDTLCTLYKALDLSRDEKGKLKTKFTTKQRDSAILSTIELYNTLYFAPSLRQRNPEILWAGDSKKAPYWRTLQFKKDVLEGLIKVPEKKKRVKNVGLVVVPPEELTEEERQLELDRADMYLELIKNGSKLPPSPVQKGKKTRAGYKGNRDTCPTQQYAARKLLSASRALSVPGYEADDIAAACTMVWPDREIYLLTVDSDWLQLVNPNVTWMCMTGFQPGVRRLDNFSEWFGKKILEENKKVQAALDPTNPRHIVDWKFMTGDTSDNLPVGTPRHYFDLLNPPVEHRLWDRPDVVEKIKAAVRPSVGETLPATKWILTGEKLPTPVYQEIGLVETL
jgi:hypothetical protein